MRKVVAEVPAPHPGHAETGERGHLVKAHLQALVVTHGIDVVVDWTGAVPGDEKRDAFVQIVHDLRMPLEEHALHRLGGLVRELNGVTIDVDHGVARPVGRRLARQGGAVRLAFQESVEPFHLLVAAVGIRDRIDQYHDVLADAPDHGLLGHGEAVGELEHGFGRAGFVRMQRGVEIIDRPCARDDALGGGGIGPARIGERRSRGFQPVEIADALLVGDREQHDIAALFGASDGEHAHARRGRGECPAIGVGGCRVDQLSGRAGDPVQEGSRRRNCRREGQIRHPGR